MRRRGNGDGDIPEMLLRYRAADWSSSGAWREAVDRWRAEHPPATLAETNRWYADDVVYPPSPDPREVTA